LPPSRAAPLDGGQSRREIITRGRLSIVEIKILGPGCPRCRAVEKVTFDALAELGVDATVTKVTEIDEITQYVMVTPGLVINEKVRCSGRVPNKEEIKKWIQEELPA